MKILKIADCLVYLTAFSMTTENFVEFEEKCQKLSSAKGVGFFGNLYSDAYQSLSSIY